MRPRGKKAVAAGIVGICRRMAEAGYVVSTEGNVSARLPSGNVLLTGTGVTKGRIVAGDVVELTPAGRKVGGRRAPSSEAPMHLYLYSSRPHAGAVVHAHPVGATAFATARRPIPVDALPEMLLEFGRVPLVRYATPSTSEVPEAISRDAAGADIFLLANHGVVACGSDLEDAYAKLERVEHACRILIAARTLGGHRKLTKRQVLRLRKSAARTVPPRPAGGGK